MTHKKLHPWLLKFKEWKNSRKIDPSLVTTRFAFMWGCSANGDKPDFSNYRYQKGPDPIYDQGLYWNGIFYIRVTKPFGMFLHFRWTARPWRRQILQIGLGRKLDGDIAITFRLQNDASAVDGTFSKNTDLAGTRWLCGRH